MGKARGRRGGRGGQGGGDSPGASDGAGPSIVPPKVPPKVPGSLLQPDSLRRVHNSTTNNKKARKWSPFTLEDIEEVDETEVDLNSTATSQPTSITATTTPEPSTPFRRPSSTSFSGFISETEEELKTYFKKSHEERLLQNYAHLGPTLTSKATFGQIGTLKTPVAAKPSLIHQEDSDFTKGRLRHIMARIEDAFDIEEWDAGQPVVGSDGSPEPLTAKPQPATYTTVGSLVRSNATQQFTAPVRIQREGALRRPPPAPIQPRGHDSTFSIRGTTPQHGMGYASPLPTQHSSYFNPSHHALRSHNMTEIEKEALLQTLGVSTSSMRSGSVPVNSRNSISKADPFLNDSAAESFNTQGFLKGKGTEPTVSTQSSLSNLDKMQTLQRLAQFPNPMQQLAKDRLSEFAVTNTQGYMATTTSMAQQPAMSLRQMDSHGGRGTDMQLGAEHEKRESGYLDYTFRFPPPGLAGPSKANPSGASYGRPPNQNLSSSAELINRMDSMDLRSHVRPGCPQPLTAGPPGPRQTVTRQVVNSHPYVQTSNMQPAGGHPATGLPPKSPWAAHNRQNMFTSVPTKGSQIRDTLSPEKGAKFYQNGFPPDMTGEFTHHYPSEEEKRYGAMPPPAMDDEEAKRQKQDDWWYSGVRRVHKTAEQHLCELEQREYGQSYLSTTQPPLSAKEPLTEEQVQAMSEAECAAPLLDGLFGTLLAYADKVPTPTNLSMLSRFTPAPTWCIDNSENGNSSFFGEDWGPPPKRLGRDPRYQPFTN